MPIEAISSVSDVKSTLLVTNNQLQRVNCLATDFIVIDVKKTSVNAMRVIFGLL